MHLTLQTDYALRVMMFAVTQARMAPDTLFSVEDVADAYGISRNHLMKIVQRLAAEGYLASFRGRNGGLRLGKPAETIRLGGLVRFLEEDFEIVACFGDNGRCRIGGCCGLQGAFAQALEAFFATLDQFTLADMVLGGRAMAVLAPMLQARGRQALSASTSS
ncbi:MAG: Rrf2 family transcriptional regulator [Proteobacteria bacterium]|nr:Rrf2 family transcriptional regulator [Pseudomonadota bacterium]